MKCMPKNINKEMVKLFNKYEIFGRDFCDMVQGRRLRKHVMDGYLYLLCRHETTAIRLLDSDIVQRAGEGLDLDGAWGDISKQCYLVNYRSWSGRHCVLYHNPHQRILRIFGQRSPDADTALRVFIQKIEKWAEDSAGTETQWELQDWTQQTTDIPTADEDLRVLIATEWGLHGIPTEDAAPAVMEDFVCYLPLQ